MAAPRTLCALNFEVSIPADCNTDMIHLAIVLGDTGLCGLMKDKNNLETNCPLRDLSVSEREILYTPLTQQTDKLKHNLKTKK